MNDNNITRFEISNFKKFEHLVVENIGQVNLITGDNNVGKTCLLEALLVSDTRTRWINSLHRSLDKRQISFHLEDVRSLSPKFPAENYFHYIFRDKTKPLSCMMESGSKGKQHLSLELADFKSADKKFQLPVGYNEFNRPDWVIFNNGLEEIPDWVYSDDLELPKTEWIPLISPFSMLSGSGLDSLLGTLDFNDKLFILETLKQWVPDIRDYDTASIGGIQLIRLATGDGRYHPITTFGDAVQKIFGYLIGIIVSSYRKFNRIMIDEIDTGIHFLKMTQEWKAIFELSEQKGVQVFATTHSMDCIKAFAQAANENEGWGDKVRLIELKEATVKGEKTMYVNTYKIADIEDAIESETDARGGTIYGAY